MTARIAPKGQNGVARADYATIGGWITERARVLDLGCGDGALLAYLASERQASGYGIEIDDAGVLASVRNGIMFLICGSYLHSTQSSSQLCACSVGASFKNV